MKLTVGSKMPEFTVMTSKQDELVLKDFENKTIFWVIRYIGCTVCRLDVQLLKNKFDEIKAKGYDLYVVMQSDKQHVSEIELPFEIILDPDFKVYNALEIAPASSKEELLGDSLEALKTKGALAATYGFSHGDYEGNELQLPALFIVDKDSTVTYAHYGKNIMDMPTVDELIEML